ncbi:MULTISPECIES: hypothetical protein [unclassified Streptomyces]|uniref:hypothetical protein n=1 Tax=unclassified Streptomyces TaxID=2593676 RepID=UPI0036FD5824
MADTYELQLALDLPGSLTSREVELLRWHLGEDGGRQDEGYEHPLWDGRGPARHIGGLHVAELRPAGGGWALTVRQEAHPDGFHDLRRIVQWLGARTTTSGPIGYLRFHESHVPDMLIARSGTVSCAFLRVAEVVEVASEKYPHT